MLRQTGLGLLAALSAAAAQAQEDDDPWAEPSGWEQAWESGATLAYAFDDGEPVWRVFGAVSANYVMQNGLEIGAAGRLEAQGDHPARAGFSGSVLPSPAAGPSLSGAFSGLHSGSVRADDGPQAQLESAYVFISGGYGDVRLGRDQGIARRFTPQVPSIYETLTLGSQTLDPGGAAFVRTDHDLTGPAAKLSLTTPRLLGLQAGASFTPEADVRGLDRDPVRAQPGAAAPELSDAFELGFNLSRVLGQGGPKLEAGLAWSQADLAPVPAFPGPSDRIETWSGGVQLAGETLSGGVTYLKSSNGLAAAHTYEAWTLGLTKTWGEYSFGAAWGEARDRLTQLEAETLNLGVSRDWGEHARIALGWREDTGADGSGGGPESSGIVIEITLSP